MKPPIWMLGPVCVAALICAVPAGAMNVDFTLRPHQIRLGESARVEFTVEGDIKAFDPKLDSIPGLQVSGPQVQNNMQYANGRRRNFTTYAYNVMPQKTGEYSIGPFEFTDESGARRVLKAATLTVLAPGATLNATTQSATLSDLLQFEVRPAKEQVYPQEVFEIAMDLYFRQVNLADNFEIRDFAIPGLDIEQPARLGSVRVERSGEMWNVVRWRAKAKALRTGRFELGPVLTVGVISDAGGDDFFLLRPRNVATVDVPAARMAIECRDLPEEGRPASFKGAIGVFDFRAVIQPANVAQGDPVTLTMQVGGKGNIDNVSCPVVPEDPRIRRYDAKMVQNDVGQGGNQGRKTYEQILMPVDAGLKELPAVEFAYFNPEDGRYHVIRQGPFPIEVRPSANPTAHVVGIAETGSSVRPAQKLGADIQYLKPVPARPAMAGARPWFLHPGVIAAQAVPLLGAAAAWMLARRRDRLAGDPRAARRLQAPRAARAALQRAADEAARANPAAALEALQAAIRDYTANRFNLGLGEISADLIRARFGEVEPQLAERLSDLYATCESRRYGGAGSVTVGDAESLAQDARQLLAKLEAIRS